MTVPQLDATDRRSLFWSKLVETVLGPPLPHRLPDRVARSIQAQEATSELLICWVQLAAIGFFATFYALSPRGYFEKVSFEPVPWMLAAYSIFTVVRLMLAVRGRLTDLLVHVTGSKETFSKYPRGDKA